MNLPPRMTTSRNRASERLASYWRPPRRWSHGPERGRFTGGRLVVRRREEGAERRDRLLLLAVAVAMGIAWIATLASTTPAIPAPKFPELTGRIVDNANLLNAEDRAWIESELAGLEAKSTDQVAVVTVPSLDGYTIEDFGYQLGRHWGLGQQGKDNGALLIVAPSERKVRIEVGRRLEPLMTDTMSAVIIQNAILPKFRSGDFSGGIRAGVRDIKDVLLGDAEAVKERAKGGRQDGATDWFSLFLILFWIAVVAYVIYAQAKHAQQNPYPQSAGRRRGRSGDGGTIVVIPGGSGDWSSDWDSGSSGGGWSGGGGDFGGGGASGSW